MLWQYNLGRFSAMHSMEYIYSFDNKQTKPQKRNFKHQFYGHWMCLIRSCEKGFYARFGYERGGEIYRIRSTLTNWVEGDLFGLRINLCFDWPENNNRSINALDSANRHILRANSSQSGMIGWKQEFLRKCEISILNFHFYSKKHSLQKTYSKSYQTHGRDHKTE